MLRRKRNDGSAIVEAAFGILILMMFTFGIISYSWMAYERVSIDWHIDHIADFLPADYESNPQQAIIEALTSDGMIDGARLTVEDASITTTPVIDVTGQDAVAKSLGSETARASSTDVDIHADVTYELKPLVSLGGLIGGGDYERELNQVITVERSYEVS